MNYEIIFYATPEGNKKVVVVFQDENFWLSQKRMAKLFGVEVNTVNYHLKEIFKSCELLEDSVIRKIRTTAADGKNYRTSFTVSTPLSESAIGSIVTRRPSSVSGRPRP